MPTRPKHQVYHSSKQKELVSTKVAQTFLFNVCVSQLCFYTCFSLLIELPGFERHLKDSLQFVILELS